MVVSSGRSPVNCVTTSPIEVRTVVDDSRRGCHPADTWTTCRRTGSAKASKPTPLCRRRTVPPGCAEGAPCHRAALRAQRLRCAVPRYGPSAVGALCDRCRRRAVRRVPSARCATGAVGTVRWPPRPADVVSHELRPEPVLPLTVRPNGAAPTRPRLPSLFRLLTPACAPRP